MKILVIEDEKALADIYTTILNGAGYDSRSEGDAGQAIELAQKHRYGFLFVDIMLPKMRGEEIISQIRANGKSKDATIIVTTNMGSGYNKELLDLLDVKEVLMKIKAGPAEILETVQKYT